MKTFLVELSKKYIIVRIILRKIKQLIIKLKYYFYRLKYKTKDNYVFFEVYGGRNYTCSPKAIYETMLEDSRFDNFVFVWSFKDVTKHFIKNKKRSIIIKSGSKDYYKYLSICKYWIVNSAIDEGITKKKNQIYVQCWHGTPLKKLRYDIEVEGASLNTTKEIRKRNDIDAKRFDYFLSPSSYCTEKFNSAFNLKNLHNNNIIIEEGYPRNETLFINNNKKYITDIKGKLNLPLNKKIILYLPTFRDNQHTSGVGYTYKINIDFESLKNKFSDEYIILFKPHYFIANKIDLTKYKNFVYNVADYDEINDLYLISDILLTDYSSVFFDFANLKKPMLFYMYDYEEYKNNLRDFYISLEELPGKICKTQEELEESLKKIKELNSSYKEKYKSFNEKYNYLDDENASKRVINHIFK